MTEQPGTDNSLLTEVELVLKKKFQKEEEIAIGEDRHKLLLL